MATIGKRKPLGQFILSKIRSLSNKNVTSSLPNPSHQKNNYTQTSINNGYDSDTEIQSGTPSEHIVHANEQDSNGLLRSREIENETHGYSDKRNEMGAVPKALHIEYQRNFEIAPQQNYSGSESDESEMPTLALHGATSDYASGSRLTLGSMEANRFRPEPLVDTSQPSGIRMLHNWRSETDVDREQRKDIHYYDLKYSKQCIITPQNKDDGNHVQPILSVTTTENIELHEKVKERTETLLKDFQVNGKGVETEGYKAALELLKRPNKHRFLILLSNGDGGTFTSMKLLDTISNGQNGSRKLQPYVLDDPNEWYCCVNKETESVVLIPDASGTTLFDSRRFEEWSRCLQQNMLRMPKEKITIIMTLKIFHNTDNRFIVRDYENYVIDLASRKYRLKAQTRKNLALHLMAKHGVRRCNSKRDESIHLERKHGLILLISEETISVIVRSERRGFVKRVNDFFENYLDQGAGFFCKPRIELVKQIEQLTDGELLTLLTVYAHGGELGVDRIEQFNNTHICSGKGAWSSISEGINMTANRGSKRTKSKPLVDVSALKLSMAYDFASKHELNKLFTVLNNGVHSLEEKSLLDVNDNKNVYRFSGDPVKNSFLIVAGKQYPYHVLNTCDEDFLYKYVGPHCAFETDQRGLYMAISNEQSANAMMKRVTDELCNRHVRNIANHYVMRDANFVEKWFVFMKKQKHLTWKVMNTTDDNTERPYCLLYYGMETPFQRNSRPPPCNITEMIVNHEKWKNRRKEQTWKEWTTNHENAALSHAAELSKASTFSEMVKMGVKVTPNSLDAAIQSSSVVIVKEIVEKGDFPYVEWCKSLQSSLVVASNIRGKEASMIIFKELGVKADVNYTLADASSLVHFAADKNDLSMLHILHGVGADLDLVSNGDTALVISTRRGYAEFTKQLIAFGADQRKRFKGMDLPIFIAASTGQVKILNFFLESNPMIVNEKDDDGRQPLHLAVKEGHEEAVRLFLQSPEVEVNAIDKNRQTALHLAANMGHTRIVDLLIRKGCTIHQNDQQGETAFSLACLRKRYASVEILLKLYVSKDILQDNKVLIRTIESNNREMMAILLKYGYNIDIVDAVHGSPIFVAIHKGMYDMVALLLQNNANVELEYEGFRPIHQTCSRGDKRMLELLLSFGANISARQSHTGDTIAHIAADKQQLQLIGEIFELPGSSCLVDVTNNKGETALHVACWSGNVGIVTLLLQEGFSPVRFTRRQNTPMTIAENGRSKARKRRDEIKGDAYHEIIKLLMGKTASVMNRSSEATTV